ncbi:MAG: NUDIX hydrolase [Candidatus Hydrogenedentes bacterium]|nr:NUDIX hydrolase [Candidatus Hydrogenedentota bacterium]
MNQSNHIIPAATVLICRDAPDGLETFMVVRHHQIDFASGALVFPGGKIADSDRDPDVAARCEGAGDDDVAMRAMKIGAIREAFEECGVLFARSNGSGELVSGERAMTLDHYRKPLAVGELGMAEFLDQEDLVLACDRLHHCAHWITPKGMPKRFDTHFFLALAPGDQVAAHDGEESVDSVWISPEAALADAESGARTIMFPTRCNLMVLGESTTVDEAIEKARARGVVTVEPTVEQTDGKVYVNIPADAGYSLTRELIR